MLYLLPGLWGLGARLALIPGDVAVSLPATGTSLPLAKGQDCPEQPPLCPFLLEGVEGVRPRKTQGLVSAVARFCWEFVSNAQSPPPPNPPFGAGSSVQHPGHCSSAPTPPISLLLTLQQLFCSPALIQGKLLFPFGLCHVLCCIFPTHSCSRSCKNRSYLSPAEAECVLASVPRHQGELHKAPLSVSP